MDSRCRVSERHGVQIMKITIARYVYIWMSLLGRACDFMALAF